jgi:hypothetical protein
MADLLKYKMFLKIVWFFISLHKDKFKMVGLHEGCIVGCTLGCITVGCMRAASGRGITSHMQPTMQPTVMQPSYSPHAAHYAAQTGLDFFTVV